MSTMQILLQVGYAMHNSCGVLVLFVIMQWLPGFFSASLISRVKDPQESILSHAIKGRIIKPNGHNG